MMSCELLLRLVAAAKHCGACDWRWVRVEQAVLPFHYHMFHGSLTECSRLLLIVSKVSYLT